MTDQQSFRQLYSEDSEQQILGSILNLPELLHHADIIQPKDMYYPYHEKMLEACFRISDGNNPLDAIILHNYFEERNELHLVNDGLIYFMELCRENASAGNIKGHIRIIRERAKERRVSIAAREIQSIIHEDDLSTDERLSEAQKIFEDAMGDDDTAQETIAVNHALKDYIEFLDWRFHNDAIHGVLTGLKTVDERLQGLKEGELYIIAGRPGSGKSTYATNIMLNAAKMGSKCYFLSLEMPRRQLMQRMLACTAGITMNSLKNASALHSSAHLITTAVHQIKEMSIEIDDNSNVDIEVFANRCRALKRKQGLDIIFADYLQLMGDRTVKDNKRIEVGNITRKLKGLSKELSVPVVLLSQLSRKCEDRNDKRPWNSDLAESGDIEANADVIQFVYRDEYYDEGTPQKGIIEIITRKFRDGEVGTDYAHFVGANNQIKDLEHEYTPPPKEQSKGKSFSNRGEF